jgi:hypothetical protein
MLDIRTTIWLLFFGNLFAAGVLAAYQGRIGVEPSYRRFMASRLLQGFAWALLAQRGEIPDVLSAHVGNAILLFGFALETIAFVESEAANGSIALVERIFLAIAGIGSVAFWTLGNTPGARVALASTATIGLFGLAAALMLGTPAASRLKRWIASLFLVFCAVLVLRTGIALFAPDAFGLLSPGLVQTVSFLMLVMIALVGGVGLPQHVFQGHAQRQWTFCPGLLILHHGGGLRRC